MRTNYPLSTFGRYRLRAVRGTMAAFGAVVLIASAGSAFAASAFTNIEESSIPAMGEKLAAPIASVTMSLDLQALQSQVALAPVARTDDLRPAPIIELPLADGRFERFRVLESPIMAPELAEQFPEIKTYEAYGEDDATAFVRFSITPLGFHAVIFRSGGSVWIDPYQTGDFEHYSVCLRSDYRRASDLEASTCGLQATPEQIEEIDALVREYEARGGDSTGDELRTYRTVIAATGEYTTFHGGTVNAGMAAIAVALNRINGIYQRDLSVLLQLVANNNLVVYTNGATDPYNNNNGGQMLGQNQTNCDAVIGAANYDIGHVFSTGGGGIANLSCVCVNGRKAQGVTGLPAPTGDIFYVDYVAHEMGHQFGATHTFNSINSSCCCGNRSAGTAYEPGSGSTIMAYAGICGVDNIQGNSDDYFHVGSFVQIRAYTESGSGNNCPVNTPTGNAPPVADAFQGANWAIPIGTPFELTGSGSDADGDPLTYCWEQYDLGPAGSPNNPSGNAPIFRSFDPVSGSSRVFPRWFDIVNNTQSQGEIMPSYVRNLKFRLTVRDGQGGSHYDEAEMITVAAIGPFQVTYPNNLGVVWQSGTNETVTWNVNGTNGAPINCANVDILLSTDGGFTYPHTILLNTPNDGSQSIQVPPIATTTGRIRVQASNNVFFDISNRNFTIESDPSSAPVAELPAGQMLIGSDPNPFSGITHIRYRLEESTPVRLQIFDASGRVMATLADGVMEAGLHTNSWDGTDINNRRVPAGVYFYRLEAGNHVESKQMVLTN